MVYAGDLWVQLPTRDLYDSQMMAIAINTAKDMYEKRQLEMKDFSLTYGDFMTPITKDQEKYNASVILPIRNIINAVYSAGGDPLRSPEAGLIISKAINNLPYADIARWKTRAKNAEQYYKNMDVLRLNGKYNENFSKWLKEDPSLWDENSSGITSPTAFVTLKDATRDWYNNRTAHMLDKAGVESFNMKYDPRYNYTGFTEQDLLNIAAEQTPGWNGTVYADYYRDIARNMIAANKMAVGDTSPITSKDIELQLQRNIAAANREYIIAPIKDADQFALDNARTANDIRAAREKAAIDFEFDKKRLMDPIFNPERNKIDKNIFREAEVLTPLFSSAHIPQGKKAGMLVTYVPSGLYKELIDPILPCSYRLAKNDKTGQSIETWEFDKSAIRKHIYTIDERGNINRSELADNNTNTRYQFIPDGVLKASRIGNGYKYYISGQLKGNNSEAPAVVKNNGSTQIWIEVKERALVYDGN